MAAPGRKRKVYDVACEYEHTDINETDLSPPDALNKRFRSGTGSHPVPDFAKEDISDALYIQIHAKACALCHIVKLTLLARRLVGF